MSAAIVTDSAADVFALLDDASPEGARQARSRLYGGHAGTLACARIEDWPKLLAGLEDALARGLYAVPVLTYELGERLLGIPAHPQEGQAPLAQVLRRALDEVLEQPFILTARARGLSRLGVKLRHALRHAGIPYLTMLGFSFGALLGGAAITETLFGRPGLGRLLVNAVTRQDMPLVLGLVIVGTLAFIAINTLIDMAYILIDHRIDAAPAA